MQPFLRNPNLIRPVPKLRVCPVPRPALVFVLVLSVVLPVLGSCLVLVFVLVLAPVLGSVVLALVVPVFTPVFGCVLVLVLARPDGVLVVLDVLLGRLNGRRPVPVPGRADPRRVVPGRVRAPVPPRPRAPSKPRRVPADPCRFVPPRRLSGPRAVPLLARVPVPCRLGVPVLRAMPPVLARFRGLVDRVPVRRASAPPGRRDVPPLASVRRAVPPGRATLGRDEPGRAVLPPRRERPALSVRVLVFVVFVRRPSFR